MYGKPMDFHWLQKRLSVAQLNTAQAHVIAQRIPRLYTLEFLQL
jgi:hypothetical protein